MGVPHFSWDFFACLYQKYLSLNIEQLFEVLDGIEEHAETKSSIVSNKLIFKFFIFFKKKVNY